jgi:hypothetical protein
VSQASSILAAGFALLAVEYPSTISKVGASGSAACVSTEVMKLKEQMEAGYQLDFDCAIEMLKTDFDELEISFHDQVQMDDDRFLVMAIRPDKTDPCIRLGLKNLKGS